MLADAAEKNRTPAILIGSLAVLALVVFGAMLLRHANQVRAATEALIAEEIAQENRAFCGKFVAAAETARQAECASGLSEIRKRHQDRIASDMIGVL